MAALAYILLPVSGLIAMLSRDDLVRAHGIQSVAFSLAWAAALYVASWLSAALTLAVWIAGALVWLVLIALAALGRSAWIRAGKVREV